MKIQLKPGCIAKMPPTTTNFTKIVQKHQRTAEAGEHHYTHIDEAAQIRHWRRANCNAYNASHGKQLRDEQNRRKKCVAKHKKIF